MHYRTLEEAGVPKSRELDRLNSEDVKEQHGFWPVKRIRRDWMEPYKDMLPVSE